MSESNSSVADVPTAGRPVTLERSRFLSYFTTLALVIYGGLFFYVCVRHVLYPGFTNTLEGDMLQEISRVTHGLPPYPKPTGEFIASPYMPLYFYAAIPFYLLGGDSFSGPRLLSVMCALISGVLVGGIAWRESRSRSAACLAAAIYFSGFSIMDACVTSVLPDAMLLLWLLLGYWFFAYGTKRFHDVLWLLFFTLAFWTKQHGAFFFGFIVLYAVFFRRNFLVRAWIVAGLLLGGPISYLILGRFLGEGFFLHTFVIPGRWDHGLWLGLRRTLFIGGCVTPFLIVLTLLYLREAIHWRERRVTPLAWFWTIALISTTVTMMAAGSSNNHYIPLIAVSAVTASLGLCDLFAFEALEPLGVWLSLFALLSVGVTAVALKSYGSLHEISLLPPAAVVVCLGLYFAQKLWRNDSVLGRVILATALVAGQLAVSFYYPPDYLPVPGYNKALSKLQEEILSLDGPVVWASYGYAPAALTGKKVLGAPSWVALEDIERQRTGQNEIDAELAGWKERFSNLENYYVLSDSCISGIPGWRSLANDLVEVKDFGNEFQAVREVGFHWYGGGSYPRFLYRKRSTAQPSESATPRQD